MRIASPSKKRKMHSGNIITCSGRSFFYDNQMVNMRTRTAASTVPSISMISNTVHAQVLLQVRLDFLDYLETVHPSDASETFLRRSIFDKTAFCLGEKEVMLVNDGVGDFIVSVWGQEKKLLYTDGSACMTLQINPSRPECVVNGTECYDG